MVLSAVRCFGSLFGLLQYGPEVSFWAVRAEGWGRAAPGVLCHSAAQPLADGAAFYCSRCARYDNSLQVLVKLSRLIGCFEGICFLTLLHSTFLSMQDWEQCTVGAAEVPQLWEIRLHPQRVLRRRMHAVRRHSQLGQSDAPKFSSGYPFLPYSVPSQTHRPLDQWFRPATSVR